MVRLGSEVKLPSEQAKYFRYEDGELVAEQRGRIRVTPTRDGAYLIVVDQGGAQRGVQGKIYTSDGKLETIIARDVVYAEVMAFQRLSSNWWSYDSTED